MPYRDRHDPRARRLNTPHALDAYMRMLMQQDQRRASWMALEDERPARIECEHADDDDWQAGVSFKAVELVARPFNVQERANYVHHQERGPRDEMIDWSIYDEEPA